MNPIFFVMEPFFKRHLKCRYLRRAKRKCNLLLIATVKLLSGGGTKRSGAITMKTVCYKFLQWESGPPYTLAGTAALIIIHHSGYSMSEGEMKSSKDGILDCSY